MISTAVFKCAEPEIASIRGGDLKPETRTGAAQAVSSEDTSGDWTTLGFGVLTDHIVDTHHVYMRSRLPRLVKLSEEVAGVHGARNPELCEVAALFSALRADLELHMIKEEQILFPLCRELARSAVVPESHFASIRAPIEIISNEHAGSETTFVLIRDLTNDFAARHDADPSWLELMDALRSFDADFTMHIHKENDVLFPAAIAREAAIGDASANKKDGRHV